jgi:hypothetical protein
MAVCKRPATSAANTASSRRSLRLVNTAPPSQVLHISLKVLK